MAKKPKLSGLLDDVAEKVIKPEPQGIRAYHGSPHDFDRFDLSKIGTGEGAQAYGHGLYFAGNEGVAKGYRNALSDAGYQRISGGFSPLEEWVYDMKAQGKGDLDTLMSAASRYGDNFKFDQYQAALDKINGLNKGHMYEVNIRANPEDFLDWDKPLVAQEPIVNKMADYYAKTLNVPSDMAREELTANRLLTGSNLYRDNAVGLAGTKPGTPLYQANYDQTAASRQLLEAGIPGIKYLDAGSRAAGDGSRNYVVFDDNLIDIIRKYGIVPGGLLGAGYAMAPSDAEAAPKVPRPRLHGPDLSGMTEAAPTPAQGRPDWIGDNGAITANPPWLRPDPNARGTLGKLYDAVTTDPVGTFKTAGSALGDAVKGYIGDVRKDPSKGVADALELGVTSLGGALPQAVWMAGSPDTANAGEDAILAERRRKMMQGLLAD